MGTFVFPYPPTHRHTGFDPKPGVNEDSNDGVEDYEPRLSKPRRVLKRRGQYSIIPSPSTEISLLNLDEGQTRQPIPVIGSSSSTSIDEETLQCHADGMLPPPSLSHSSHSSDSSLHGAAAGLAPGCTAPTGSRHWRLTNSTLMAYNSMRGPFREAGRDVYCWAERCQELNLLKVVMDEGEGTYDEILADVNSLYHSEQPSPDDHPGRKDVFCLPRAPYEHIRNPDTSQSHDTPAADPILAHNPQAVQYQVPRIGHENLCIDSENWGYSDQGDKNIEGIALPEEDEFVISDDEGHPDDGRISPCTFRLFTQNCRRRYDTHQIIDQVLQNYQPTNLRLETIGPLGMEHQAPRFPAQYHPFSSGSGYACEGEDGDEDGQGVDLVQMAKIVTIEYWVFTGYWPKFLDEVAYV
uniref:Uncharacterized protein n=1 Tax=Bionectria ochroleuca TaxID=29856 RepID=A0A8H7TRD2_BIOOC